MVVSLLVNLTSLKQIFWCKSIRSPNLLGNVVIFSNLAKCTPKKWLVISVNTIWVTS